MLNGALLGLTKKEIKEQFESIVEFSELENFIDQPLRTYSSGMQVRLGFSVAVHINPQILLVDEVLAVGDDAFQKKCIQKMNEFRQNGVSMVFVSHDMSQMKRMCNRVALLQEGKITAIGEPEKVVERYLEMLEVGSTLP